VATSGFTFVSWWQSCCFRGRAGRFHLLFINHIILNYCEGNYTEHKRQAKGVWLISVSTKLRLQRKANLNRFLPGTKEKMEQFPFLHTQKKFCADRSYIRHLKHSAGHPQNCSFLHCSVNTIG
jgi:hypothetical protein